MSRYPYTYCADFIRKHGPHDGLSPKLSRADAASLKAKIAEAIGMSEVDLANRLADAYLREEGVSNG